MRGYSPQSGVEISADVRRGRWRRWEWFVDRLCLSVAALRRSSGRRRSATSAALLRFREHKIRRLNSEFLFPYFESLLLHPTGKRSTWRRLCYLLSGSVVRTYEACCPATAEGTLGFFSVINYYDCEPETCHSPSGSSIRGSA